MTQGGDLAFEEAGFTCCIQTPEGQQEVEPVTIDWIHLEETKGS